MRELMERDSRLIQISTLVHHLLRFIVCLAVDNTVLCWVRDGRNVATAGILRRWLTVVGQGTFRCCFLSNGLQALGNLLLVSLILGLEELLEQSTAAVASIRSGSLGHLGSLCKVILHQLVIFATAGFEGGAGRKAVSRVFRSIEVDGVRCIRNDEEFLRVVQLRVFEHAIRDGGVLLTRRKVVGVGDVEDGLDCLFRGEFQECVVIQMCVDVVDFRTGESWVCAFLLLLITLC